MSEVRGPASTSATPPLARLFAHLHGGTALTAPFDPDAAAAAAYADGHRDGCAQAESALAPLRERLADAAAKLDAACHIDTAQLRPLFTALTQRLCAAALTAELRLSPDALQPLVEAALAAAGTRAARLRLNPATLAALALPALAIAVEGDAALAEDEIALDGPAFALETSLASRLAVVVAALA